jgi:hypothetical protein
MDAEIYEDHIHIDPKGPAAAIIATTIIDHIKNTDMTQFPVPEYQPATKEPRQNQENRTPYTRTTPTNRETTTQQRPFSKTIVVPHASAGRVIGAKQTGINKLQVNYHVTVTYMSAKNTDPIFKINGNRDQVLQAEQEINRIVNTQDYSDQRRQTYSGPPQSTNQECNCDSCKPPQNTCTNQSRQLSIGSASWADQPQTQWNRTPICKKQPYTQ